MSLEQFKTQILLLHSEQSTLDSLSAGFNERYTVHCATSGSEALNTLGQADIDVIVTAQDLPGMSGLDALREAKKRSPETIGILLAGNDGEDVEALVGDQEVFQIVRGGVTPESLRGVIDNATRQSRLIALAESANDTTADMDEPGAEHIVMETSENGSAIISDGTGRMPILNPDKVSPEANVGSRAVDVLVLTKDQEFLATVKESARGMHNVIYANTLAQADEAVAKHKIGVAVVDAAMVGENVEKLTMHLRTTARRLVSIVAGRRDDGEMLMDLINRGKVYRFLLKPVSPGRARLAVEASVKHHLEAPDAAFKTIGSPAAPKSIPKAAPKPEPKPKPKPKPKAIPEPKAAPVAKKKAEPAPKPVSKPENSGTVPTIRVEPRPVPVDSSSLMDDALGTAFGGDDTSFTETMTGIVRTVGESISSVAGRIKTETPDETPTEPTIESPTETPAATPTDIPVENSSSGGSLFDKPKILGMGAAAVVAVLAVGWWMFGGPEDPAPTEEALAGTPTLTEADQIIEAPVPAQPEIDVDELLEEARLAAEAGQIFNPPGSNAIELYLSAQQTVPDNNIVAGELAGVIDQTLGMAESSLLERRPEDAAAALQRVALADPDNARLPFLSAQLEQMQLRDFLDTSRLAIREGRYEDAAVALDGGRALGIDSAAEIDVVAEELSNALSAQRVDDVLAKANARLDEGKLTAPSNDNARYYYELALSVDPGNTAAQQGLAVVASTLVLMARAEIDASRFDSADILLADARRLDPNSAELAASLTALSTARDRAAEEQRKADLRAAEEKAAAEKAEAERVAAVEKAEAERVAAVEKAEAERVAAAEKAEAERVAAAEKVEAERVAAATLAAKRAASEQAAVERLSIEQSAAGSPAAQSSSNQAPVVDQQAAEVVADEPIADEPIDEDSSIGEAVALAAIASASIADTAEPGLEPEPEPEPVLEPEPASEPTSVFNQAPVAVSSLRRTKYVSPKYPRAAQRRNLSGWVDVVFTVDVDGTVKNISVNQSNPGVTFVNAAVSAVEDWEFEPVIENGVATQKRAAVRMLFALE